MQAGHTYYLETDHLGTPRVAIDPARDVAVWRWDLKGEAFGSTAPDEDPDRDGTAFVLDMRFPGQRYDAVTGLYYNYFRDYDSATGSYGQSDPAGLIGGIATYAYVSNDPVQETDPLGLWPNNFRAPSAHRRPPGPGGDYGRGTQKGPSSPIGSSGIKATPGAWGIPNPGGEDIYRCVAAVCQTTPGMCLPNTATMRPLQFVGRVPDRYPLANIFQRTMKECMCLKFRTDEQIMQYELSLPTASDDDIKEAAGETLRMLLQKRQQQQKIRLRLFQSPTRR
jgi:RHS repeat-associated protein